MVSQCNVSVSLWRYLGGTIMSELTEPLAERFYREVKALIELTRKEPLLGVILLGAITFYGWHEFLIEKPDDKPPNPSSTSSELENKPSADFNLDGEWICTVYCPAGGVNKIARIIQNDLQLTFINEGNQPSNGHFKNSNEVIADGWGNLTGVLRHKGTEIHWGNTSIWIRK
jgi:hypothetical protein